MKNDKPTFYTICILFSIFFILSCYSTYVVYDANKVPVNVNHDFYFMGDLYFYDSSDLEIARYTCNTESCGFASSYEEEYIDNYYKDGTLSDLGIVNSNYVFIEDGDEVILFNLSLNDTVIVIDKLKFYDVKINENYILINVDGLWGSLSLSNMTPLIPAIYDQLSISKNLDGVNLDGTILLASSDNEYFIIDNEDNLLSTKFSEKIVDYNHDFIFTCDQYCHVFNYDGYEFLTSYTIDDIIRTNNFYGIIQGDYLMVYKEFNDKYLGIYDISEYENIEIVDVVIGYTVVADGVELE